MKFREIENGWNGNVGTEEAEDVLGGRTFVGGVLCGPREGAKRRDVHRFNGTFLVKVLLLLWCARLRALCMRFLRRCLYDFRELFVGVLYDLCTFAYALCAMSP